MRGRAWLATVATLIVMSGCGVPTSDGAEAIAPSDVPYGLLSPSTTTSAPSSASAEHDSPRVYFIGPDDALTPSGRDVDGTGLRERLEDLLRQLAAGPTSVERDAELATALPPGVRLSVAAVEEGTVTIDLSGPGEAPSGEQSRLAVGQIVMTATALPEVDAVLLAREGELLEAPLASGELTGEPLTAAEYRELAVDPPS
jgi:spore germination protein GerM